LRELLGRFDLGFGKLENSEGPFLGCKLATAVCSLRFQLARLEPVEEEGGRRNLLVVEVRHTGLAEVVQVDHPSLTSVYIYIPLMNITSSAPLLVRILVLKQK
jgi:hypothetical protein